jgi:Family of unknown function (DUF5677)
MTVGDAGRNPRLATLRHMNAASEQDETEKAADAIRQLNELSKALGSLEVDANIASASAVGFGWWMRILRTADGVRRMHEADLSQEASPLLRTILHHTAALEWLRQHPAEVLDALRSEHARRRQSLGQKAKARDWDLKQINFGPAPTSDKPDGLIFLDRFEKLCNHIGAPNLYVAYMLESAYVHASGLSADTYLELDDQGSPQLRGSPSMSGVPLKVTLMFAAIATNVLGHFINDDRLTEASESIGERLSLPLTLGSVSGDAT